MGRHLTMTTTASEIVHNEPIDIRLKYRHSTTPPISSIDSCAYFQDMMGVFVTITIFPNNDYLIEREWEEEQWYQFEGMNGNVYEREIGIKHRNGVSIEETTALGLQGPADGSQSVNEFLPSLHADTARIAIDIEVLTSVPESELDVNDFNHIELLYVGVGFQPDSSHSPITEVLFRPEDGPAGECKLIEAFCTWIDEHPSQTLLTYRGSQFDLSHLRNRATIAAENAAVRDETPYEGLGERVANALQSYTYVDLGEIAFKAFEYPSLDDLLDRFSIDVPETYWAAYNHGLDAREWRTEQQSHEPIDDPVVVSADIPQFGDHWLTLRDHGATEISRFRSLDALLRKCVETDIIPLFELSHIQPFFANYRFETADERSE